jgi:hypothetical protein
LEEIRLGKDKIKTRVVRIIPAMRAKILFLGKNAFFIIIKPLLVNKLCMHKEIIILDYVLNEKGKEMGQVRSQDSGVRSQNTLRV